MYKVLIGFILITLIISIFNPFDNEISVAKLILEQGSVEVDSGWGFVTVTQDRDLSLYDSIKNIDAQAAVVIYDSIVIDLEPGTEILLEDLSKKLVKIYQSSGLTWNKFTKITGVQGYEISTPNTVALVRGTEFGMSDEEVLVAEGEVEVESGGIIMILKEFEKSTRRILPSLAALPAGEYEGDYAPAASMPREPSLEKSVMSADDIDKMINKKEAMLKHMRKVPVLAQAIKEQNKEIEELKEQN